MLLAHPRLLLSIVSARQVLRWASLLLTSAHLLLYKTTQLHLEILLVDVLSELLLGHVHHGALLLLELLQLLWLKVLGLATEEPHGCMSLLVREREAIQASDPGNAGSLPKELGLLVCCHLGLELEGLV